MNNYKIKELLPLGLAFVGLISSIVGHLFTGISFEWKLIPGFLLMVICLFLYSRSKRIYKYALGISLLLGLFNLIAFFSIAEFYFNLYLIFFNVKIRGYALMLCVAFISVFHKEINSKFAGKQLIEEPTKTTIDNSLLVAFKHRFKDLPIEEINRRSLEEGLVPEAKQALEELMAAKRDPQN